GQGTLLACHSEHEGALVKVTVTNQLAEIRKSRGIGAGELARRIKVSRQTVYAIEAGTYVPNTELALRLARELEITVDDLFALREDSMKAAEPISTDVLSASSAEKGQPVRVCRIDARWVSVPVSASPYYMPQADGIIEGTVKKGRRAKLVVFAKEEASDKRLVLA